MDNIEALFDWTLYGALVRHERTVHGYKTAESFSDAITRDMGIQVTRDMIYKIEQGRQTPDSMQFMAINVFLFGRPCPAGLYKQCASGALIFHIPEWPVNMNYLE